MKRNPPKSIVYRDVSDYGGDKFTSIGSRAIHQHGSAYYASYQGEWWALKRVSGIGWVLNYRSGLTLDDIKRNPAAAGGRGHRQMKRRRNVEQGFYADGVFHPIRSSSDYNPKRGGDMGGRSMSEYARRGRKNPGTKAERAVRAQKASAKRRVAVALAKYLKQQNPGVKLAGAQVEHLKGGVLKITPIKMNPRRSRFGSASDFERLPRSRSTGPYYVWAGNLRHGPFSSKKEASSFAAYQRKSGVRGARVSED